MITSDYSIVIEGEISDHLSGAFTTLDVTPADGTTLLLAHDIDQAALHGIISRVEALGLTLLSVRREDGCAP